MLNRVTAHAGIAPVDAAGTCLQGKDSMSREMERRNKSLRRFYSVGEVEAITSLSRSTIYRKMAQGTFPVSVPISEGRVGWERRAVDAWCEARLAARLAR
jgi:prophage regulatory protein